jgi:hypothetical protein
MTSASDIQCLVLKKFNLINTFVGLDIRNFFLYKNYNLLLSISQFKSATCYCGSPHSGHQHEHHQHKSHQTNILYTCDSNIFANTVATISDNQCSIISYLATCLDLTGYALHHL